MTRCSEASRAAGEPLAGSAPRADVWVVVEQVAGWGDAPLARAEHGVRVLMARGPRRRPPGTAQTAGSAADVSPSHDDARSGGGPEGPARAWVAHCGPHPVLRRGVVDHPADVAGWDLAGIAAGSHRSWGAPDPDPLLLVCANGRRDRCCGHSGGRLADELWRGPLAHRVLTCTHLGGHRFAPTALLLPTGNLHGRLDHSAALDLLRCASVGSVPAGTLRGFSTLDEAEQVADAHARQLWGDAGSAPLAVRIRHVGSDRALAEVTPPPSLGPTTAPLTVALVRSTATRVLSCGRAPEPLARWVVDTAMS